MHVNFDAIKTTITSKTGRQILLTQKHSPKILFGIGVVGIVGTVVLACRSTLYLDATLEVTNKKLCEAWDAHKKGLPSYGDSEWNKDKAVIRVRGAVAIAKLYWPAAAVGVISIGCLTGSHVILTRRNVGLTAAYAAVERGLAEYRARVVDEYGEEKDREFRYGTEMHEIVEETKKGQVVSRVQRVGPHGDSIYAKFFAKETSQNWSPEPVYNRMYIQCQQDYANHRLRAYGFVMLNDVYESLGLPRTSAGCVVGWILKNGGDDYIDFGVFDNNQNARDFVMGNEGSILLDFNVDGEVYKLIGKGQ